MYVECSQSWQMQTPACQLKIIIKYIHMALEG